MHGRVIAARPRGVKRDAPRLVPKQEMSSASIRKNLKHDGQSGFFTDRSFGQDENSEDAPQSHHSSRGLHSTVLSSSINGLKDMTIDVSTSASSCACRKSIKKLVGSHSFRSLMNAVIVVSAIQMGIAVDVGGSSWDDLWQVCDNVFATVFSLEMVLMILAHGLQYFCDPWQICDFCVATLSIVDTWVLRDSDGQNNGFVRQFRLLRLLRIARITRVAPELFIIVEGLVSSMKSMVWVFVLLFVILYAAAICCVVVLGSPDSGYPAYSDSESALRAEQVDKFNSYMYFGTVPRAILTLFGVVLLSEWPIIRAIAELHSAFVPLFIVLVIMVTFGVLNVIIGIVVERTIEAMSALKEEECHVAMKRQENIATQLADIMYELDQDGDTRLSRKECEDAIAHYSFLEVVDSLGLPEGFTVADLMHMLDTNGSGQLSKSEFVQGLFRLIFSNDFQRECIVNMVLGRIHNTVCRMHDSLKGDIQSGIDEIRNEIRQSLGCEFRSLVPETAAPASTNSCAEQAVSSSSRHEKQSLHAVSSRNVVAVGVNLVDETGVPLEQQYEQSWEPIDSAPEVQISSKTSRGNVSSFCCITESVTVDVLPSHYEDNVDAAPSKNRVPGEQTVGNSARGVTSTANEAAIQKGVLNESRRQHYL